VKQDSSASSTIDAEVRALRSSSTTDQNRNVAARAPPCRLRRLKHFRDFSIGLDGGTGNSAVSLTNGSMNAWLRLSASSRCRTAGGGLRHRAAVRSRGAGGRGPTRCAAAAQLHQAERDAIPDRNQQELRFRRIRRSPCAREKATAPILDSTNSDPSAKRTFVRPQDEG
jgi:hypothetical protein